MKLRHLALALLLMPLTPHTAFALGPVVGPGCVASWNAVSTSGGVPLVAADGTVSYKLYVSPTATTGGPATPPPGSSVVLAAGPSAPICPTLTLGQQYTYWEATILTPPPPPPGQLPGAPAEGPPSIGVPFVMGNPAPTTKIPDAATNPTIR